MNHNGLAHQVHPVQQLLVGKFFPWNLILTQLGWPASIPSFASGFVACQCVSTTKREISAKEPRLV